MKTFTLLCCYLGPNSSTHCVPESMLWFLQVLGAFQREKGYQRVDVWRKGESSEGEIFALTAKTSDSLKVYKECPRYSLDEE